MTMMMQFQVLATCYWSTEINHGADLEWCKYTVVVLGVLSDPRVAVVDVRLVDVLVDDLRHHDKPLRQKVRLISITQ